MSCPQVLLIVAPTPRHPVKTPSFTLRAYNIFYKSFGIKNRVLHWVTFLLTLVSQKWYNTLYREGVFFVIYDIDLPVGAKKRLRELEELTVSEDLQLLTKIPFAKKL